MIDVANAYRNYLDALARNQAPAPNKGDASSGGGILGINQARSGGAQVGLSGGVPGIWGTAQIGIAVDSTRHAALLWTKGGGVGSGVAGSAGFSIFSSDARSLNGYAGPFDDKGGSLQVYELVGVGADLQSGTDKAGHEVHVFSAGGSGSVRLTGPIAGEIHQAETTTTVIPLDPVDFVVRAPGNAVDWLAGQIHVDATRLIGPADGGF
jgi:hypothetical protein